MPQSVITVWPGEQAIQAGVQWMERSEGWTAGHRDHSCPEDSQMQTGAESQHWRPGPDPLRFPGLETDRCSGLVWGHGMEFDFQRAMENSCCYGDAGNATQMWNCFGCERKICWFTVYYNEKYLNLKTEGTHAFLSFGSITVWWRIYFPVWCH